MNTPQQAFARSIVKRRRIMTVLACLLIAQFLYRMLVTRWEWPARAEVYLTMTFDGMMLIGLIGLHIQLINARPPQGIAPAPRAAGPPRKPVAAAPKPEGAPPKPVAAAPMNPAQPQKPPQAVHPQPVPQHQQSGRTPMRTPKSVQTGVWVLFIVGTLAGLGLFGIRLKSKASYWTGHFNTTIPTRNYPEMPGY